MTTIVLVTQNALSSQDAQELVALSDRPESMSFFLAVPEQPTSASMTAVLDDWEMDVTAGRGAGAANHPDLQQNPAAIAEHQAEQVLRTSVETLQAAGAAAEGVVTPKHPLESIGDLVAHHKPDEVVVMIRHHRLSEATSSDLAAKIHRKFDVPSLRVKAH
jgi:hypothetical protein